MDLLAQAQGVDLSFEIMPQLPMSHKKKVRSGIQGWTASERRQEKCRILLRFQPGHTDEEHVREGKPFLFSPTGAIDRGLTEGIDRNTVQNQRKVVDIVVASKTVIYVFCNCDRDDTLPESHSMYQAPGPIHFLFSQVMDRMYHSRH